MNKHDKKLLISILFFLALKAATSAQLNNVFKATYLDNYDGDTVNLLIKVPSESQLYELEEKKLKCRLWRIDTWELRKKSQTEDQNEMAKAAKYFTEAKLKGKDFTVELLYKERRKRFWQKNRKGRWVVIIRPDGEEYRLGHLLRNKGWTTGKYELSTVPAQRVKKWKKKRRKRRRISKA